MKAYILSIPSKKCDDIIWTKPLNNYLLSIYGNTSDYQQDLAQFNKLRQDIRGVHPDLTGIKLYFKYYTQLELLDLRISFAGANKHKRITFSWYDAFDQLSHHQQYALPFEKACVLFNLGAIISKYAAQKYQESVNSSSEDADALFKEAVTNFQQAAGVYQFLNENFLHAPSQDLHPSTVRFLTKLNLAQSHEIFNLKVISGDLEQKKNSLISKLCRSTANHYEELFNDVSHLLSNRDNPASGPTSTYAIVESGIEDENDDDEVGGVDNVRILGSSEYDPDSEANSIPDNKVAAHIDSGWIAVIQFKMFFYKSLAYYFHGLQLESTRKYGDAIAYLSKSSDLLNETPSTLLKAISKNADSYELLDNFKYQKDAVLIKLKELNNDNDMIYHEIIPSLVTLADIKPMDSAKVIPMNKVPFFNEINEQNYNHFLKNVVPINIHELLSYYSEEKSQLLRNEIDEVDVSNEELSSVLEFLKMPKSLVNLKEILNSDKKVEAAGPNTNDTKISSQTIDQASQIKRAYNLDQANKEQIGQLRKQIYDVINEGESLIGVNGGLFRYKDDLIKLKKSLYDATNSDTRLFGLINNENGYLYSVLGDKGPDSSEFKQLFQLPSQGSTKDFSSGNANNDVSLLDIDDRDMSSPAKSKEESIDQQIKSIEDILHDLNVIKANKNKLITNFKQEIHNDDISDILMLNCKVKSTSEIKSVIFPGELNKFKPYSQELDKLIGKQNEFISQLKNEWTKLASDPEVNKVQSSKQFEAELIKNQTEKITRFFSENWNPYHQGLAKGVEIYRQLLQYAEGIKSNILNEQQQQQFQQAPPSRSSSSVANQFGEMSLSNTGLHTQQPQYSGGYNPNSGHNFFSNNSPSLATGQASSGYLSKASTGSLSNAGDVNYSRPPPALPPKRPSQGSFGADVGGQYRSIPLQEQQQTPSSQQYQYQPQQQQQNPQFTGFGSNQQYQQSQHQTGGNGGSHLIYDQPSTYQPDMYNFFSKN